MSNVAVTIRNALVNRAEISRSKDRTLYISVTVCYGYGQTREQQVAKALDLTQDNMQRLFDVCYVDEWHDILDKPVCVALVDDLIVGIANFITNNWLWFTDDETVRLTAVETRCR